jgi:hypothetical protein
MTNPSSRSGTLGVLWGVYGVVRLVIAVVLLYYSGVATVMFGALLSRVPNPFVLMTDFHILYGIIVVWSVLSGVLALLAGAAFITGMGSARGIAIAAAFLALPELPFGIMLGVYTLVLLLPSDGGQI